MSARSSLASLIAGEGVWDDRVPHVVDAILSSDWLAAHDDEVREQERSLNDEQLLRDVHFWADRLELAPIDVPALVVLLIDATPTGPDDLVWAQHVANAIARETEATP